MRWVKFCFFAALLFFAVAPSSAQQNDGELFAEGRIALDKYKDCAASLNALKQVSPEGQKNPMWIYYMAKANECAGNIADALNYYKAYAATNPSPEITEKIGDLQYKVDQQVERERAAYAQRAAQEAAAEARRSAQAAAAVRAAQERAARVPLARQNLPVTMSRLGELFSQTTQWCEISQNSVTGESCKKARWRVLQAGNCILKYHRDADYWTDEHDVTIDLARVTDASAEYDPPPAYDYGGWALNLRFATQPTPAVSIVHYEAKHNLRNEDVVSGYFSEKQPANATEAAKLINDAALACSQ
ncbi:MAG: hypothetical protein ABSD61_10065 [Terracidiphilus sp.]|jgi:hypothetical protein